MKADIAFFLNLSGPYPELRLSDSRGRPVRPEYRLYAGAARYALMEFETQIARQARFLPWDTEGQSSDLDTVLLDPGTG
jgi:hypothetical protein